MMTNDSLLYIVSISLLTALCTREYKGEKSYEEFLISKEGPTKTSHNKIFIGKPSDIDLV